MLCLRIPSIAESEWTDSKFRNRRSQLFRLRTRIYKDMTWSRTRICIRNVWHGSGQIIHIRIRNIGLRSEWFELRVACAILAQNLFWVLERGASKGVEARVSRGVPYPPPPPPVNATAYPPGWILFGSRACWHPLSQQGCHAAAAIRLLKERVYPLALRHWPWRPPAGLGRVLKHACCHVAIHRVSSCRCWRIRQ